MVNYSKHEKWLKIHIFLQNLKLFEQVIKSVILHIFLYLSTSWSIFSFIIYF